MKLFNNIFLVACLLLSSQFISASADKQFTAYFQSWSEKWSDKGSGLTLANLPPYVNTVIISFFKPDNSYSSGSLSLANTGLDFSSDASVVKDAIAAAKSNGAKVLVAVGGATYTNWDGLNANGVGAFVKDFGLDGVDVDFEPANAGCTQNGGSVSCSTDQQFQKIVQDLRSAVPQPAILSMAGWSIGAYGEGDFSSAQPQGANTGLSVNLLKSDAGKSLDQINVMSYDAGPTFDPKQAFQAYKSLFKGKVVLGVEVPPEAWGGHVLSISELDGLCDYVNQNGGDGDGMMLWSLNKKPDGGASASNPDATMISQEVCKKFGLKSCDSPLPTVTGIPEDAEVEEVIVGLNAEKNMWLSHRMRGEAMASYMSAQNKQKNENVLDALKLLVDGLSDEMEQYFGERAQELGEMIANLDSHKDALWNQYLEDFMMASQYVKNSDPRGVTYVFDNKSGASIKVLTPLKFSEDDLVNEKGMAEAIADWNAKKNVWLSHYLRGQAMASYMSNQNDQKNEETNKQDNNSLESLKGMLMEQYFGDRAHELAEIVANLDSHKDALWNQYLDDFMIANQYVRNTDQNGMTYTFDNNSGASIRLLTPLKFSGDDLVKEAVADKDLKRALRGSSTKVIEY